MAKNDTADTGIVLHDYTPEAQPGKYDDYITAMLAADEQIEKDDPDGYKAGRRKAATVLSPSDPVEKDGKTTDKPLDTTKRLFQESARLRDRTAKLVKTTPQGDGTVALDFILVAKQTRPRKPAGQSEAATPERAEV